MTVKSPFGGSYKWMGPSLNWMTQGMDASLRKLIRALVTQDPPQIANARATFEDEITEILILSDLTGRMYTLKKADMVPPPSGPAMTDAGPEEPGEEIEIKFGAIPFREAIEDIVSREPRLAKSAAEVADLYSRTHAFALAKSTDLVLTRKIQDVMTTLMEKDMDPSDAGKVIAEMGDWTRAYGETVFRTNAATAFSEGQFQQALDPDVADLIPAFEYDAVLDSNTRPNHRAANGLVAGTRDSIWRVFTPPVGYNCFVPGTLVSGNFIAGSKARYSGPVVEIKTKNGHRLTVTVNHPVLTTLGWRPANGLKKGDYLFGYNADIKLFDQRGLPFFAPFCDILPPRGAVDNQDVPARIEDVFDSLLTSAVGSSPCRARTTPLDFHGDAKWINGDIDIVGAYGLLMYDPPEFEREIGEYLPLEFPWPSSSDSLYRRSRFGKLLGGSNPTPSGIPGGTALAVDDGPVIPTALTERPFQNLRLGPAANWDAHADESARDGYSVDPDFVRELLHAASGLIAVDEIIEIRYHEFSGHVYDLQSVHGYILSQGIITSNCRCDLRFVDRYELQDRGLLDKSGRVIRYTPPNFAHAYPDPGFGQRQSAYRR